MVLKSLSISIVLTRRQACGTGYDAVLLAQRGFEAYGLEVSSEAVEEAKKFARGQSMDAGKIDFVKGDFFKRDWLPTLQGQFDLVYDYTARLTTHLHSLLFTD